MSKQVINRRTSLQERLTSSGLLALVILIGLVLPLAADQGEDHNEETWIEKVSFHGFASVAYSYNFNNPESRQNTLRVFDFDDDSFKLDVAEAVIQKPAEKPGDTGFRIDFTAGSSIPRVTAASGLFRDADGVAEDFDLQQAYVSYIANLGNGLRFDFGKHVTHTGAEVIEGFDAFNDNYSRSFLFGFAIPFTHTGLKISYPFGSRFSVMGLVANGWDNVRDNNDSKSFGAQATIIPGKTVTLYLNYMGGPERENNSHDWRHLYDLVAVWKPKESLTFTLNYDYATDKNAVAVGEDARWNGVAAYARIQIWDHFALALRGEYFDDENGFRTGTGQRLKEFTLTPEWRPDDHVVFRTEFRWDRSNEEVFSEEDRLKDSQTTLAFNMLVTF